MRQSRIKKSMLSSKLPNIERDFQELEDLFVMIDQDKNGFVFVQDLIDIVETLGYEFRVNQLYQILKYMKNNQKNKVYYEEFKDLLTKRLSLDEEEDLEKIYGVYKQ